MSSAGVQEEGCRALRDLAANEKTNRDAIAEKGGVEAVVKGMQEHVSSAGVQEQGCVPAWWSILGEGKQMKR